MHRYSSILQFFNPSILQFFNSSMKRIYLNYILLAIGIWLVVGCQSSDFKPSNLQSFNPSIFQSLYHSLDSLVACEKTTVKNKENAIRIIAEGVADQTLSPTELYKLNERLYTEYMAFRYDSAFAIASRNLAIAQRLNDPQRECRSRLQLAHVLSVAGMMMNASRIMEGINPEALPPDLQEEYYFQQVETHLLESEYTTGTAYWKSNFDATTSDRKKLLEVASKDSHYYIITKAAYLVEEGKAKQAADLMENYLPRLKEGTRDYSVVTSILGYIYWRMNNEQKHEYYLLRSAISDSKAAIRENNSLRELALLLFKKGDYDRAFTYVNTVVNNAVAYGSNLRSMQASQIVPEIVQSYQQMRDEQRQTTTNWLIALAVAVVFLIATLAVILRMSQRHREDKERIEKMNRELNKVVAQLEENSKQMAESNKVKDEYIGRFLELSSSLIEMEEQENKMLNRLARDRKMAELYDVIKAKKTAVEAAARFYKAFDTAFLNIYPYFVEEVNKLLTSDNRIEPKEERMTTELRVLALVRLGITDNKKIADILRSSITTVYTYRSKLKAKAKNKDLFEDEVKLIGAY